MKRLTESRRCVAAMVAAEGGHALPPVRNN